MQDYLLNNLILNGDTIMWTTPAATEMRFGFEVTMYVMKLPTSVITNERPKVSLGDLK
jgi:coenzyme PQQ precursor peptide PqqA